MDPADPSWQRDDAVVDCNSCSVTFSLFNRRHHCRSCGRIFCDDCASIFITWEKVDKATRVCKSCFKNLSPIDQSRTYDVIHPKNVESHTVVILIPGALGTRYNYIYTTEFLSKNFTVIPMDLPGLSVRSHETLNPENAIGAIHEIVTSIHCQGKKIILFGYSMGGYIAMKFVHEHPTLCDALILGGCMNEFYGLAAEAVFGVVGFIYSLASKETQANFIPSSFPSVQKERMNRAYLTTTLRYDAWDSCVETMLEPYEGFYATCLKKYPGKVLFFVGENDMYQSLERFIQSSKNSQNHIIPRGDHLCLIDQNCFDYVHKIIKDFILEIEKGREE